MQEAPCGLCGIGPGPGAALQAAVLRWLLIRLACGGGAVADAPGFQGKPPPEASPASSCVRIAGRAYEETESEGDAVAVAQARVALGRRTKFETLAAFRQTSRALEESVTAHKSSADARQELEDIQHESADMKLENERLQQQSQRLQRALAAAAASSSSEQRQRDLRGLLHGLLLALCCALAQGAVLLLYWMMRSAEGTRGGSRHWRCCTCSWQTLSQLWVVLLLMELGFAVLWHYGIIQPFLRELVVNFYLAAGACMLLGLLFYQAWLGIRHAIEEVVEVSDYIHDKVDDMLHIFGLRATLATLEGKEHLDSGPQVRRPRRLPELGNDGREVRTCGSCC